MDRNPTFFLPSQPQPEIRMKSREEARQDVKDTVLQLKGSAQHMSIYDFTLCQQIKI